MVTEEIIMNCVKNGQSRQVVHEVIRELSMIATKHVKQDGQPNNLIALIKENQFLKLNGAELDGILNPLNYIGFANIQAITYSNEVIKPIIQKNKKNKKLEFTI